MAETSRKDPVVLPGTAIPMPRAEMPTAPGMDWRLSDETLDQIRDIDQNIRQARLRASSFLVD